LKVKINFNKLFEGKDEEISKILDEWMEKNK
jgi:hypothetical protein